MPTKAAPSELAFRKIANTLITKPEQTRDFLMAINQQDLNLVIVVLKVMCLLHRQTLYCSKVDSKVYQKLLPRERQRWVEIDTLAKGHTGDFYRTPLLTKLVY